MCLVSLDKASGFINWKNEVNKEITEPFLMDKIVMIFSTDGTLMVMIKKAGKSLRKEYGYDIHPKQSLSLKKIIYTFRLVMETQSIYVNL